MTTIFAKQVQDKKIGIILVAHKPVNKLQSPNS